MSKNYNLMQFFTYQHLKPELQAFSKPFCEAAEIIDRLLPDNPEKTTALRKLLEAKDCAVRASIFKFSEPTQRCAGSGEAGTTTPPGFENFPTGNGLNG